MLQQREIQELQMWFRSVDRDNSGSITAHELQMVTFGGFPLGMDIAIKLVKVFDKDRSGTIGEYPFAALSCLFATDGCLVPEAARLSPLLRPCVKHTP